MGLAAGQARLLTITGRKSDCEFESMRLSHQKIALARELADVSNEYQNSLDQTKLVYDYYGTGDTSTQFSYGIMMTPSVLNDYMPITLTDSASRVVLNSKYAAAAKAAGIPQEGLSTLPSENMRNEFVQNLGSTGLITSTLANTISDIPYNQAAGFGGGTTVAVSTKSGNINELISYLSTTNTDTFDASTVDNYSRSGVLCCTDKGDTADIRIMKNDTSWTSYNKGSGEVTDMTLSQLLSSDSEDQYYLGYEGVYGEQTPVYGLVLMQNFLTDSGGFLDWLMDQFSSVLDLGDGYTSKALEYAYSEVTDLLYKSDTSSTWGGQTGHDYWENRLLTTSDYNGGDLDDDTQFKNDDVYYYVSQISSGWGGSNPDDKNNSTSKDEGYQEDCVKASNEYIGFVSVNSRKGGGDDGNDHATAALNLNNVAKSFLTYFADYMNGVAQIDSATGQEVFSVNKGSTANSNLCTDNYTFQYTWSTGTEISSDDLGMATFYDALFNQICANGWTENDNVDDNEYLQQMLQNGMMYISKVKDDGYYYQGNYATDSYIKEVTDDTKIAQAEAKYTTEKAKLNAKEETLDLKMKNLDTEISSLSTEYDTVKNTISKNIEKSFKRYNA